MNDLQKRLEKLRNRPTLYELAMTKGETKILIAYSRTGRLRMYRACTDNRRATAIVSIAGTEKIHFADTGEFATIGEWSVAFTGRTQRESIIAGELPYCVDVVATMAQSVKAPPAPMAAPPASEVL